MKLPVEKVLERPAVDRQELRSREEPQLTADGVGHHCLNANHVVGTTFKDFMKPEVATLMQAMTTATPDNITYEARYRQPVIPRPFTFRSKAWLCRGDSCGMSWVWVAT